MSFDRQTEKAAEDLSDLFDAMIRMCGFVFKNLRSDKLPGRIGFSAAAALFAGGDVKASEPFSRYSRIHLPRELFPIPSSRAMSLA